MIYKVIVTETAVDFLRKLKKEERNRIKSKLKHLSTNPKLGKSLVGKLSGLWSLRIGQYRAIYSIKNSELVILVVKVGHRRNIYDK